MLYHLKCELHDGSGASTRCLISNAVSRFPCDTAMERGLRIGGPWMTILIGAIISLPNGRSLVQQYHLLHKGS